MSEEQTFSCVIIGLGFTGIVLLGALLITPAPKHTIVKSFLITTLARSIFAVIPPIIFEASPDGITDLLGHPMLQAFCVADAIIVRYLTLTMAAFGISFTLPLLYASCKYVKNPEYGGSRNVPCGKLGLAALVLGPWFWALPTVFADLPNLKRDLSYVAPRFELGMCNIEASVSNTLGLALMLSALAIATFNSIAFMYHLFRSVKLPLQSLTLGRFGSTQLLRFAALLCIYMISIILYAIISASWVRWKETSRVGSTKFHTLFKISVIWQSITPILYFFIFAAHEEMFSVWRAWSRGFQRPQLESSSKWSHSKQRGLENASVSEEDHERVRWWKITKSKSCANPDAESSCLSSTIEQHEPYVEAPASHSIVPQRILLRPILQHTATSNSIVRTPRPSDSLSLPPPPRPIGSRGADPEGTVSQPPLPLVTMPSLSALGGAASTVDVTEIVKFDRHLARSESHLQSSAGTISSRTSVADEAECSDSGSWMSYL